MIRKKETGITLIALVVTIIVLIILATVSINMVVGENGLIKKAEQARDAYENSSKREEEGLDSMAEEYDYLMELRKLPQGPTGKPLVEGLTEIQKRTVKAEDKYEKEVTVPKGFKVVPDCGTTVSDGIVIEDADGNQFVWVPCTEAQYKKHTYKTPNEDDTKVSTPDRGDTTNPWKTYDYRKYVDWQEESSVETNTKSVKENGGFYVARFEAGVPDNASFSINNESNKDKMTYYTNSTSTGNKSKNVTEENGTKLKPVSKQGMQAWNYISQEHAVEVSKNMYSGAESNYGVTSQLIDGIAWDRTVEWIASEKGKENIVTDSKEYGNYNNNSTQLTEDVLYAQHVWSTKNDNNKTTAWVIANKYKKGQPKLGAETLTDTEGSTKYNSADYTNGQSYNTSTHALSKRIELATGSVSNFMLKNIYDMAGNMYEWTTETGRHNTTDANTATGTKFAVLRGGGFNSNGASNPVSCRSGNIAVSVASFGLGFRVVLYVK